MAFGPYAAGICFPIGSDVPLNAAQSPMVTWDGLDLTPPDPLLLYAPTDVLPAAAYAARTPATFYAKALAPRHTSRRRHRDSNPQLISLRRARTVRAMELSGSGCPRSPDLPAV